MSTKEVYLDEDYNEVPEDQASYLALSSYSKEGKLLSELFIELKVKTKIEKKEHAFVLHKHYGEGIHTHFDLRWQMSSTHKQEMNIYHQPNSWKGKMVAGRFKDFVESEESVREWMVTQGKHLERHVIGVEGPTYIDVLDSGSLEIKEKTDKGIKLMIGGNELKGEYDFFFTGSMEELTKGEGHLSEYEQFAKDGEPLPDKFYKWQPSKEKTRFVLQRHWPTGKKEPISPGEEVPQMHKSFVLEYDPEKEESVAAAMEMIQEIVAEAEMGVEDSKKLLDSSVIKGTAWFLASRFLEKIRDHLDLRMEISKTELVGWTIHPPVPGGMTALDAFKSRIAGEEKTQVDPKGVKGHIPHDWLTRTGTLRFPTRHEGQPEQTAHFIEVAQMEIVDEGEVKFGVQREDLHEYFFFGKVMKGRWVVRKLKIGQEAAHWAWLLMRPEDQKPLDPVEHRDSGYYELDRTKTPSTEERAEIDQETHRAREERGQAV